MYSSQSVITLFAEVSHGLQTLSLAERHYIELERKRGKFFNLIARVLGRSQRTLSREVKRNTCLREYRHQQADRLARERHKNKDSAVKLTEEIKSIIDKCRRDD
jgi:IS30 family transposase